MTISDIILQERDLEPQLADRYLHAEWISWDIETTGLDWAQDRLATCQLHTDSVGSSVVRISPDGPAPSNVMKLLASPTVTKIFHHAPFDLRFMRHHWGVVASAVVCTKIAAKIVLPGREPRNYSLKPLLHDLLALDISKSERLSDWTREELSESQVAYAVNDVRHLFALYDDIRARGMANGSWPLVERSFGYLPTRVETDILGIGDVFAY